MCEFCLSCSSAGPSAHMCLAGMGMGAGDVRVHHCLPPGGGPPGHAAHKNDGPAALGQQALVGVLYCTIAASACSWDALLPDNTALPACRPYYLLHYTYGMDYTLEVQHSRSVTALAFLRRGAPSSMRQQGMVCTQGEFTPGKYGEWRFDKRTYAQQPPPRHLGSPPDRMSNELVRHLVAAINEATDAIPGWDDYAKTGVAKELWNGEAAVA